MRLSHYLIVSLSAVWASTTAACADEGGSFPGSFAAEALRAEFPEQASLILSDGPAHGDREAFARSSEGGFIALHNAGAQADDADDANDADEDERSLEPSTLHAHRARARRSLRAELPSSGDNPVRFQLPDGLEIRVREDGSLGSAELADGAVAYPRQGGTSFWTTAKTGFEEWLLLDAGRAFADRAAAAWDLEGGSARQDGDVIEIVAGGEARLRVTAPAAFAAGGRPVPVRLVAVRPDRIEIFVDARGERALVDPLWTSTEALIIPRTYGLTVSLPSGDVLLAGGEGENLEQPLLAELYSPVTGTWSPAGSIKQPIQEHTMTLLATGKVLLAGGHHIDYALGKGEIVASTQLFIPVTKTWVTAAPMLTARSSHTATSLADGRLLVAGGTVGAGKSLTASAEIYNPQTNAWKAAAPMTTSRSGHVATLLSDGRVLVTGGQVQAGAVFTASAEIYDPTANAWKLAAPMSQPRLQHATRTLPDGRVLAAGKSYTESPGEVASGDAEIYDPKGNTWTPTALMAHPAWSVTLTLLPTGKVLLTHHEKPPHTTLAQVYDLAEDVWSLAKQPLEPHHWRTATLLSTGKVLVVGGGAGVDLAPFGELFDPGSGLGLPCAEGNDCESGFCASGVCCDRACDSGACEVCSVAAGALANGMCAALSGRSCDDGNPCTIGDACDSGACGGSPRSCEPIDGCHEAGSCDSSTGLCSSPRKEDGATCGEGGVCSEGLCAADPEHPFQTKPQLSMPSTGGCGCRVGTGGGRAGWLAGLALIVSLARRRKRRERPLREPRS